MIGYLSGTVYSVKKQHIILLVSGIGFSVQVPLRYGISQGLAVSLEIYSHMTQDSGLQLYGFENNDDKDIFVLIIGCSGLGPKIGLAVLNGLTPSLFISAILTGDSKALSCIEGIGIKKAESMIMQLKDKIAKLSLSHATISTSAGNIKQLSDVLSSLGYSRYEITTSLEFLKHKELIQTASFDELLRKSLTHLSKRGTSSSLT